MKPDLYSLPLGFADELIIDNFAGGGGTSTGLEWAFGRPVDIAINHDPEALAMHAINHPHTKHLCESVWDVDPIKVTNNQPVGLVWLSPDCKHFSKAKGGTPVAKHIRGLAWVGMRWAARCKPRVIMLENVEEFQTWGPLIKGVDDKWYPDPAKKGVTFKSFIRQLKGHGYAVDWRELRACDAGAPTIRKRFFLVARRDGIPISWPEHSHGDPVSAAVLAGKLLPWRTAADCIDFNLPSQSIFERKKPLVPNTRRRVAKGLWKHVFCNPRPFLIGQGGPAYSGKPVSLDKPIGSITTENHRAIAIPVLAPFIGEHANASSQRNMPADAPLRTQCAQVKGGHFSVVAPIMAPLRGTSEAHLGAHSVKSPLSTISASGTHHAMAAAFFEQANGGFYEGDGRAADSPLSTITSSGSNQRLITAYCVKYYSNGGQWQACDVPMHTLPTKARMGLVTATKVPLNALAPEWRQRAKQCADLLHEYLPEHFPEPADLVLMGEWVLVDITLRMLKARELYLAQSFPANYVIDEIPNPALLFKDGRQTAQNPLSVPRIPLTNTAQVRMCGNSVSPLQACALAAANFAHERQIARAA